MTSSVTYFLRESDYDKFVTADSRVPLIDLFPNGLTIEMRGSEIVSIRQPICGDDPEMMDRIEQGLKRMNALLLSNEEE